MITTEDRARAAMQAIGATVRDAPPLELAPGARTLPAAADEVQFGGHGTRRFGRYRLGLRRPGGADRPGSPGPDRRWPSKLAPIAAAVAVAAVAIALVTIKDFPNGRVAAPSPSTASAAPVGKSATIPGVPEYYVAWMQADTPYLVVGETATGKQVGEVAEPHGVYLEEIYGAAADDTTFIAMGDRLGGPDGGTAVWYLLRIDPGGRTPARLTQVPIPVRQNPAGVAISPDGTELAVALTGSPATVRIYSIATGRVLRAWSATVPGTVAVESWTASGGSSQFTAARVLRWSSDGRRLAFAWNSTAIRALDASAPDGNLITSSTPLATIGTTGDKHNSVTCNASQGWELIAGGQGVICGGSVKADGPTSTGSGGACTYRGRTSIGFLEETNDGKGGVPTSLVDFEPECSATAGYPDGAYIGWANADGSVVIGSQVWDGHVRFGLFRDGRFTPLPALPVSVPVPTGVLIGTYDW
jgi:hypothetical protein